jgi:hypothetical protein
MLLFSIGLQSFCTFLYTCTQMHSMYMYMVHIVQRLGCKHKKIFVNIKGAQESIPLVALQAGTSNRAVVPACQAENRFLGSLKGLQIRVLWAGSTDPLLRGSGVLFREKGSGASWSAQVEFYR